MAEISNSVPGGGAAAARPSSSAAAPGGVSPAGAADGGLAREVRELHWIWIVFLGPALLGLFSEFARGVPDAFTQNRSDRFYLASLAGAAALMELVRWSFLRAPGEPSSPEEGLSGRLGLALLALWAAVLAALAAWSLRNPSLKVPPEAPLLGAGTAAIVLGAALSRRAWREARPGCLARRAAAEAAAWETGCRSLEFLPDTVGLTSSELAARLGGKPPRRALEALIAEGLAEEAFKSAFDRNPRYRFAPGVKREFNELTADVFETLAQKGEPRTAARSVSPFWGGRTAWVVRALRRTAARGWTEEDPASPAGPARLYRVTPFGAQAYRVLTPILDALPYCEDGESWSLGEVCAKVGGDERPVRAALEALILGSLAEEVRRDPEDPAPRYWGLSDRHAVYRWVEPWQEKRSRETN